MREPTKAIFLSYASQDADTARRLCDALRAKGLEVWFDQSELRGGDAWDSSIRKQIKECALFVPMISASTNARSEGYFRLEWKLAVDRSHLMADDQAFFLPVVIDDLPEPSARVPDRFRERQWSRLGDDAVIMSFAESVKKMVLGDVMPAREEAHVSARPKISVDEGFWVAVLPFRYRGSNPELAALSEGLSEEIVSGLSRFSYLRVVARSATLHFPNEGTDVRTIGKALGARYLMEGTLRQAGAVLRVVVNLLDAETGTHLWAETYERTFDPAALFALQDDLVPRIVSTVADSYGVLPHSMSGALRSRRPDQLTPYEALLRSFGYLERATAEEHALARACLEHAVKTAPDNADCWASLATMYIHEHHVGFNPLPDPLGRALRAAQNAVAAGPSNHLAYNALAWALHFRMEFSASRNAAERTLALNPMDGSTSARMGMLIAYAGDWEVGCAILERARQLNPNHPGWYWFGPCVNAYRKNDYRGALDIALKINMPGYYYVNALRVICYAQLGDAEATSRVLKELLVLKADVAAAARAEFRKWGYTEELVEHLLDGMRKAGLAIPNSTAPVATSP